MAVSAGNRPEGVVILGSTGSIGRAALDVISTLSDRFRVEGLAAGSNHALLQQQIDRFRPTYASAIGDISGLRDARFLTGDRALSEMATLPSARYLVVATTGHAAIEPTIEALRAGKIVCLANKETIVAAGAIVMPIARQGTGELRPVDSEHSALWQCLGGDRFPTSRVRRLILTASGGPFRGWTPDLMARVTPADALRHPTWNMGAKVTIDSATMMNKGLELIEAAWLFDCPLDQIDIVIHPQSIVHSLVEYVDGSVLAQLASHDMRIPIQYALTWPDRVPGPGTLLTMLDLNRLEFEDLSTTSYPMVALARRAGELGSTWPTVLSTADDVAVNAFLRGRIAFGDMPGLVQNVLDAHSPDSTELTLESIHSADAWARACATRMVERGGSRA